MGLEESDPNVMGTVELLPQNRCEFGYYISLIRKGQFLLYCQFEYSFTCQRLLIQNVGALSLMSSLLSFGLTAQSRQCNYLISRSEQTAQPPSESSKPSNNLGR